MRFLRGRELWGDLPGGPVAVVPASETVVRDDGTPAFP